MFESYTENARSVMDRARQEAQKLRHDHIGTEHILLGLIEVKEGFAAEVLRHRDVDLARTREQVKKMVKHGAGPESGDYNTLPRTAHAQNALNDAVKEARALKHNKIGTEHILLGLLYENEGTGAQVLQNLGLKLDEVRQDALFFINRSKNIRMTE
ncbi:MAG: ATP-dependent Clp protease ATP-binding subunit ClpC1 [Planctomycetes bacterium ADurb.Bin412]|nr:MAG: ATP-dependent Clp protease ATP-binding subunit ClpC1 [Planctomycetes bacterium ADurb.Bin412]